MGEAKKQRTEAFMQQGLIVQVPDFQWNGCQVALIVPVSKGVNPDKMAQEFSQEIQGLCVRANESKVSDLYELHFALQVRIEEKLNEAA